MLNFYDNKNTSLVTITVHKIKTDWSKHSNNTQKQIGNVFIGYKLIKGKNFTITTYLTIDKVNRVRHMS